MNPNAGLIGGLADTVRTAVATVLGGRRVDALIDFPNYPNVGDSAIYLGQLACLEALGVPEPGFVCDFTTYDRTELERRLGGGVILLTGGGSLGDLWPTAQACREDILRSFRDHPVIQLPQSIHFRRSDTLARARTIFNQHRALTLFVRDEESRAIAERDLGVPARLCPDMAFCLGPLTPVGSPTTDVVWLARRDPERRHAPPAAAGAWTTDWLDEPHTVLRRLNWSLMVATARRPRARLRRRLHRATFRSLARERLERGLRVLSSGRVVITDRLHGHVLALLLGVPHVVLDNSYGKISSFYAAWTSQAVHVGLAEGPRQAMDLARSWLDVSGDGERS